MSPIWLAVIGAGYWGPNLVRAALATPAPACRLAIHDRGIDRLQPTKAVPRDERRQALISYRTGDTLIPALPEREALISVMAEFSTASAERRPALTDAGAGLGALRLLEAASRSADSNGVRVAMTGAAA